MQKLFFAIFAALIAALAIGQAYNPGMPFDPASPGPIGATTPASGKFTSLTGSGGATGAATCWKAGGLIGYCSSVVGVSGLCSCN